MITERIEQIECGCERHDALAGIGRDALILELEKLGFGGGNQPIPSDWRAYYGDDELREFVLEYADRFTPSA